MFFFSSLTKHDMIAMSSTVNDEKHGLNRTRSTKLNWERNPLNCVERCLTYRLNMNNSK